MSNFWPVGLDLDDTQSPLQILEVANSEWNSGSHGKLSLVLQDGVSSNGDSTITVHAKDVLKNRTVSLFTVVYRRNAAYPALIVFPSDDIPDYLKKSYVVPGHVEFTAATVFKKTSEPRVVKNEWVCDGPSEFRGKLRDAFNVGIVRAAIVNLLAIPVASEQASVKEQVKRGDSDAEEGLPSETDAE